ncbi:MAG: hypothetical protein Kow0068_23920 [Marinilabiliales bacterium]
MTTIKSNKYTINKSQAFVFKYLNNLDNWEKLMPDRVINWESEETHCDFTIQGTASLGMKIIETLPENLIKLCEYGKSPFAFYLKVMIHKVDNINSQVEMILEADLNPMLKLVAVNPLKNFLNLILENLDKV